MRNTGLQNISIYLGYLMVIISMYLLFSCQQNNSQGKASVSQQDFLTFKIYEQADQSINYDQKVAASVQVFLNNEMVYWDTAQIKYRGGFSRAFAKKNFGVTFSRPYRLENSPDRAKWVFNANYIDKTFLRHKLSYDFFSAMDNTNIAPKSFFAEVYLNDFYQGLYVIMDRIDGQKLKEEVLASFPLIWKEPSVFMDNPYDNIEKPKNTFHQKSPHIDSSMHEHIMHDLVSFIHNSTDDIFIQNAFHYFSKSSIMDWHLLLLLSNNGDGVVKNFFLYKKDSLDKFHIAPWDYDHSYGRDGDNELNFLERGINIQRNVLFHRLLKLNPDNYLQDLSERWRFHRKHLLTFNTINNYIDENAELIDSLVIRNNEIWPTSDTTWYYDTNSFSEEIELMKNYFELRIPQLDSVFDRLYETSIYEIP